MKRIASLSAALFAGTLVLTLSYVSVRAEEPVATPAPAPSPETAENPRMFDRDGKRIVGFELMSETEISGLRSLLFSIKDPALRDQARAEHRKAMEKRAAERGVKLQE
jgi:hypothetical protein